MKKASSFLTILLVFVLLFSLAAIESNAFAAPLEEEIDTAYHIVCDVCPVEVSYARNIQFKSDSTDKNHCTYSFDTVYGHFSYEIDLSTGDILKSEEPDIEAARAQEGFHEPIEYMKLLDLVFQQSPIDFSQSKTIRTSLQSDKSVAVRFGSAYGDFLYVIDYLTGEILDREEPDVEAALADPDFQERLSSDDILTAVFKDCPLDIANAKNIKVALRSDDRWTVTFGSVYGDFLYVVDPYGEIMDFVEPDIEAVKAQEKFQEPLDPEAVIDLVFNQCPISIGQAKNLKVAPQKNDTWSVTFDSDYGNFAYKVDGTTREVIEKAEPDLEAVKAQESFSEPLDAEGAINRVFSVSPIKIPEMKNIKAAKRTNDSWAVTFDSDYGSFLYVIDAKTGEILEKNEPDIK